MFAAYRIGAHLRCAAVVVVGLGLLVAPLSPAKAVPPSAAAFTSNDAILKWINGYRHRPDPDRLPSVVRTLSAMQAFKAAESSGAYIGFIAGVLGSNASHADDLIAKMLPIDPADHWVLVRAIAYSGLPNWRELLATFVDRMATRRAMIDKYLDGKLPRLEQIDYRTDKPGMLDKIKSTLRIGKDQKKAVTLEPTPELIDVLWGYYLATGSYVPIQHVIKLLPLANDKDNVDSLTTGSAAKFTLASNAVRDSDLLAMLKWADKNQPKEVKVVLDDVSPGTLRILAVISPAPTRVSDVESMDAGEIDVARLAGRFPRGTDIRETVVEVGAASGGRR